MGDQSSIPSLILQVVFFLFIILYFFYGQKIQIAIWVRDIERAVRRLRVMKDHAREVAIKSTKELGKPKDDPTTRVDQFLERFFIQPVNMDPAGIVSKFDHLLDVRDNSFKDEVKRIAPEAEDATLNNLENLMEASLDLNFMYRVVKHYLLYGRRTQAYIIIAQLHMMLPMIMEVADAYDGAVQAFAQGQPIGDGAGPLLANRLVRGRERRKLEKDMHVAETTLEGRRVFVLKAEGPGGNVGKPGDALRSLIDSLEGKVNSIIMVDAALKLEGENTGDISEGVGAAIGGIGTERFKIEEIAVKHKIPMLAVIIKMSLKEAIAPMKREIYDGVEKAIERVKRVIKENTKEGDTIIIAGIGNTIGIA